MSAPDDDRPRPPSVEAQRTRRMGLPPVPGPPELRVAADQPTDELPGPEPRQPTQAWQDWHPLQPRVVPRERSRARYVVPAVVLLVLVAGVVVTLVYRR